MLKAARSHASNPEGPPDILQTLALFTGDLWQNLIGIQFVAKAISADVLEQSMGNIKNRYRWNSNLRWKTPKQTALLLCSNMLKLITFELQ